MSTPVVEFRGITKRFAGVTALDDVSVSIEPGECHALVGENGAGKSTLGKILAGIHRPDAGTMCIGGRAARFRSPADAAAAGVGMVHQELAFCPDLSVAENLSLGRTPRRGGLFVDRAAMHARAEAMVARIGIHLDVRQPMRGLSIAQEQMVQIASAVGGGARILVFDEPTSSLSEGEAQRLFELIAALRRDGVTLIYVSHRMPEILRLADRVTVLRDGRHVETLPRAEVSEDRLVRRMVGRSLEEYFPRHLERPRGPVAMRVEHLSSPARFADVSFDLHGGEIVGLAGLVGSGRSEVARAIFGLDRAATGCVSVEDRPVRIGSVRDALRAGIGLTPEDRKRQGLILPLSSRVNFSLRILRRLRRFGLLDQRRERGEVSKYFAKLDVSAPSPDAPVSVLSGGNQQKVVLARWLAAGGRVLIVDEPTRGVDVAAKAMIHALLDELAGRGMAILLISSELPEVIHLSTRILVMRGGRIVADVARGEATQDRLMREMAGVGAAA